MNRAPLSALSQVAIGDGRTNQAAKLALAAWPRDGGDQHLRLETTLQNLSKAVAGKLYLDQLQHDGFVNGALLTKDETRILSWSGDGTVRLWDAAAGQQIGPAMKHGGIVNGALLTKDETRILSWSGDSRLWDVATGQQIGPAMKQAGHVYALMTKDEARILSWSNDQTLRLWDAATGQQIGPAMKHGGIVNGALMAKDETRILSWSDDGTLRLWDATWPKGNLLEIACALLKDRDATDASKQYGVTITTPICTPKTATLVPDWSMIERAP